MRVRIRRDPDDTERWIIETKSSFFAPWWFQCSCAGEGAKERALKTAELIMNPEIVEVKKR